MKTILEYSHDEAKIFLLKEESYFSFDLPKYFVFQRLLNRVSEEIKGKPLRDLCRDHHKIGESKRYKDCPNKYEKVNYTFFNNKDGKFSWRPLQLIHPVLYVSLVHKITEEENWKVIVNRFNEFSNILNTKCSSLPVESNNHLSDKATAINSWWQLSEQRAIELALKYEYVLHTDISDCYNSIYTHSIPWALHGKEMAKAERNSDQLVGNAIDVHLQGMSFGQTNGIPQGSTLMDLIAEMVLGYADLELSRAQDLILTDYKIIRHRDDYRIFSNNPQEAGLITKKLTEILANLGLRLNAQKTMLSSDVVRDSIKPDKLYWISNKQETENLQQHLFLIHNLAHKFPNSGSVSKALNLFLGRIEESNEIRANALVMVSIVTDIALKNPRTYSISSAILSKLLSVINEEAKRNEIMDSINKRFEGVPNTGHLEVWLQRVTLKINRHKSFREILCKKLNDSSIEIWNSEWLKPGLKKVLDKESIVDEEIIEKMDRVITSGEVELFNSKNSSDD
jgi:RNA-directed DNA polymerase